MFCLTNSLKTSKPRKARNEASQINHNTDNQHSTSIPYRHVTAKFDAEAPDELSVSQGDIVLFEFEDNNHNGNWSHVISLRTQNSGFVPSQILSAEPRTNSQYKKKIPRSTVDPIDHNSHIHRAHHVSDQPSSNGDNIRLQHQHVRDHQQRFNIPHSLQGSSSKQSFPKYPNLRDLSPHAYYNVRPSDPQYQRSELEWRPFHRRDCGLYVVLCNFVSREENDLSVSPCEYVLVLNKDDEDWYWVRRECDTKEGFVPSRFICDFEKVNSILNKGNSTATMKSSNPINYHTYINHTDQHSICHQHI